jgi:hypothetical protein
MSATVAERRWLLAVRMAVAAGVWSLGLVLAALLVPAYSGDTTTAGVATLTEQTLVQNEGLWSLALVMVPLIACGVVALAMVHRRRDDARWALPAAWAAIGVLVLVALVSITSVGAFMVPVAVLLALTVRITPGWGDVRARPVTDA